ncbi:hypothetical protein A2U01_0053528, partial [Trifolium medium]|nr:hypothetical protein [Trifolium medium]
VPIAANRAKTYKSKKVEIPKGTEIGKKGLKKKRKAEKKASGERSQKNKQVIIQSDSEADVKANVQDIMASKKKRLGGKRVPMNIPPAPMDNISFHSEESVQEVEICLPEKDCTRKG